MIGVVVPAHDQDQEGLLGLCLQSVLRAARCPRLNGEQVVLIVAVDASNSRNDALARQMGAFTVPVRLKNLGQARAAGAQLALDLGVRWLAFTDPDSLVAPDWLSAQLAQDSDAVCGDVVVHDWESYSEPASVHYDGNTALVPAQLQPTPHHVHGANFGVSADAYCAAGGFRALESKEDVALVAALERYGARIAWSTAPRVVASARQAWHEPVELDVLKLDRFDHESARLAARATLQAAA